MPENTTENQAIKTEQKRLDTLDKKEDQKVVVDEKDYGKTMLNKVNTFVTKIDSDTGVKDSKILGTKSFQALKERAKKDVVNKLSKIDEKNIKIEADRLESTLKSMEEDFDKVKRYEYSYFEISDRFIDRINKGNQSLHPLLAQIKDLNEREDVSIDMFGMKDVRNGDSFKIMDQDKREHARMTIKRIDPTTKKITVTEGDSKTETTFDSPQSLADNIEARRGSYERSLDKTRSWSTILNVKISYEKRVVKTETTIESKDAVKKAQGLVQEQAVIGLEQFIVDANQDVAFGNEIKERGTLAGLFKEGSLKLQDGKIIFDAKFDQQYDASFRAGALKELKTYLEHKVAGDNIENEKNPDKKLMRQADLALQEGRIKDARTFSIKFLQEMKAHPEKLTDEMQCERARASGIVESIYKGGVQKLQVANERVFGKSAIDAMKGVKKYDMFKPGDNAGMAVYEKAFEVMRARNAKIAAGLMNQTTDDEFQKDPADAYKKAQQAALDVPENLVLFISHGGSQTNEVRAAVTDCEKIWNKVATAETGFMSEQSKDQEKTQLIDAIQALRTIGETDNASLYVAEGFKDSLSLQKNLSPEILQKRKQEIIMGLQKNKPEYTKRIKEQLASDAAAKGERSPDISEEKLSQLVDESIAKAADEQMQNGMLKDIAVNSRMAGGDFYQGKDKELAELYVQMKNPEGKWLVFSDDDYVKLGDTVIKIALEALVIGISGGVGSLVASGARLGVSALGGTELLGQAIGVVAEAGAFEATNKLIAPHITGGPGFTTAGDFAMDWARSIAMFSALKASGEYVKIGQEARGLKAGEAAGFTAEEGAMALGQQGMGRGAKTLDWAKALNAEAASMTLVSTIEEAALNEHWDPKDLTAAYANNLKMILGLRLGSKLVHPLTAPMHDAAGAIEAKAGEVSAKRIEKGSQPSSLFDFVKNVGGQDVKDVIEKFIPKVTEPVKVEELARVEELQKSAPAEIHTETQPTAENVPNEQMKKVQKGIEEVGEKDIESRIAEMNAELGPNGLKGSELTVVRKTKEGVVIVDETGKLMVLEIGKDNAREILKNIKRTDGALKSKSYELRKEVLARSEGSVTSCDAFTHGEVPKGDGLDAFLANENNWFTERRELHESMLQSELEKARELSKRLNDAEPTVYLLRGNTAAGKTTRLKKDPLFASAADAKGEVTGAINPDTFKGLLRKNDAQESGIPNSSQVHEESSMLAKKVTKRIEGDNPGISQLSYVIDQRLDKESKVNDYIDRAKKSGRKVKILDIDAPLDSSCQRVLTRPVSGIDPTVPFEAIASGYEGVRKNRAKLLERIETDDAVSDYVLYGTDELGGVVKVAEKKDGKFTILDEELFNKAKAGEEVAADVEKIAHTVIDDAYIQKAEGWLQPYLERNKGKTLKQALDQHSELLVDPRDSLYYMNGAESNLRKTSRTANGIVDVSASKDKADKMADGLTEQEAATRAIENYKQTMQRLFTQRERAFSSPEEVKIFIEGVGRDINSGITKEEFLIRDGEDSKKYPYTKVADLPKAMEDFYKELHQKLNDPAQDPIELAAWIEYRVNLSDHFFSDGCGKSSLALVQWALMRKGLPLPKLASKNDTIQHSPKTIRGIDPAADKAAVDKIAKMYKQQMYSI